MQIAIDKINSKRYLLFWIRNHQMLIIITTIDIITENSKKYLLENLLKIIKTFIEKSLTMKKKYAVQQI